MGMLAWVAVAAVLGITTHFAVRGLRTRSVVLISSGVAGLLSLYALYVLYSAWTSAESIAAGRPYCVQVASRDNYRSVTTWLDLLGRYRQEAQTSLNFLLKQQSFSIPNVYAPRVSTSDSSL
jgi:hypothetical protein